MATFQVNGSVINALTRAGIPALQIEAWEKPARTSRKLASTTTDAKGRFGLQFDLRISPQNPDFIRRTG